MHQQEYLDELRYELSTMDAWDAGRDAIVQLIWALEEDQEAAADAA